jgi:hypothetical protein
MYVILMKHIYYFYFFKHNKKIKFKIISILVACFWIIITVILFQIYQDKFLILNSSIIAALLLLTFSLNPLAYIINDFYYSLKNRLI